MRLFGKDGIAYLNVHFISPCFAVRGMPAGICGLCQAVPVFIYYISN
jgi:hypothetical protein